MRRLWLSVLCALCVAAPSAAAAPSPARVESLVLTLVNQERARAGKAALRPHGRLAAQARAHSRAMASAGALSHAGLATRVARAGLRAPGVAACENVAAYRPSVFRGEEDVARTIHRLWKASPPHRRCMLDGRMVLAGVGVYRDAAGKWWATLDAVKP